MIIREEEFAAVPFWFWNGDQSEDEITRQLTLAKEGGWRGMTVHARSGNMTPYMSERWIELVRHTCREAKRLGLEIWIYDEEGFPSGTVGWRLPQKDDKYRQKLLTFKKLSGKAAKEEEGVLRYFDLAHPEEPIAKEAIADDMSVLVTKRTINQYFMTDYLNPEAGAEFINMTHKVYERELKEYFGDPIKVIYTDDIGYVFNPDAVMAWSDGLEATFQKKFGYSITDKLSYLIENLEGSAQIRRDYRECCTTMLAENFVRPMHEWAQQNGLIFSGHLCCDEGPFALLSRITGDPAAFYMEEDIPGLDDFCTFNTSLRFMTEARNTNRNGAIQNQVRGFPVTTVCKQVTSISSQFKQGKCSAEVLTCVGWGLPVRSQMAQIFFEFALGINIIVHHDCSYNTGGGTKRDCPASYFFQQPYFAVNKEMYASVNRSLALLNRGIIKADTLVIFPSCAAWECDDGSTATECGPGSSPATEYTCTYPAKEGAKTSGYYTELLQNLNLELLRRHVSFEYGYERILRSYAKVEAGTIHLGEGAYQTIIIPGIDKLPEDVQCVIDSFEASGGRVIRIETLQDLPNDLTPAINADGLSPEVAVCTRIFEGKTEYYLVNYSLTSEAIRIKDAASLELYNPISGTIIEENGACPACFLLPPLKSCHFLPKGTIEDVKRTPLHESIFSTKEKMLYRATVASDWTIKCENDNNYIIDQATDEDGELFIYNSKGCDYTGKALSHTIESDIALTKAKLYFESDNSEAPVVNGTSVTIDSSIAHPATQALAGAELQGAIKQGANTVQIKMLDKNPEFIYISGDFGVELNGDRAKITELKPLAFGDLQKQGLPFYWGGVSYTTEIEIENPDEALFLEFEEADGVVDLEVNGIRTGVLYGAPWSFPLKGYLKSGKNTLKLTLRNTAQNIFGPLRKSGLDNVSRWKPEQPEGMQPDDYSTASFGIFDIPSVKGC